MDASEGFIQCAMVMQRFPEGSVLPIGKEWGQQDAYLLSDSFLCIRWQESSAHTQQYFMNTVKKLYEILMHFQSIISQRAISIKISPNF